MRRCAGLMGSGQPEVMVLFDCRMYYWLVLYRSPSRSVDVHQRQGGAIGLFSVIFDLMETRLDLNRVT